MCRNFKLDSEKFRNRDEFYSLNFSSEAYARLIVGDALWDVEPTIAQHKFQITDTLKLIPPT